MPNKNSKFNTEHGLSKHDLELLHHRETIAKDQVQLGAKPSTNFKDFGKRFFKNKLATFSLIVFIALVLAAFIIVKLSPFSPNKPITNSPLFLIANWTPSGYKGGWVLKSANFQEYQLLVRLLGADHVKILADTGTRYILEFNPGDYLHSHFHLGYHFPIGTNNLGEDNWTRVWYGTLNSLSLALLVTLITSFVGIAIGSYVGFNAGSRADIIIMRFVDTLNGIPQLVWFILLTILLPQGFWTLLIALAAIGWVPVTYQTRVYILKVKDADYIAAAKTVGISEFVLIFKYALPNILGRLISNFVRAIPLVIFSQASLAFLNIIPPTDANIGTVIYDATQYLQTNLWYLLVPTLILFVITLSMQFIANGLNDALDPKVGQNG